jgi:hypothetical protein
VDKRWKKGGPSPNPRGRPRKEQTMLLDVRAAFERALNKKVAVPHGDRKVLMTRIEIGLEQLFNQFAKGDRHARQDLMKYANELGIDLLGKHRQTLEEALTPNHQAVVDAFLARRTAAGNVAPAEPALAPPELRDDDGSEAETGSADHIPEPAVRAEAAPESPPKAKGAPSPRAGNVALADPALALPVRRNDNSPAAETASANRVANQAAGQAEAAPQSPPKAKGAALPRAGNVALADPAPPVRRNDNSPVAETASANKVADQAAGRAEAAPQSPPNAKGLPFPEPPQIPGQKPFSQMTPMARYAWYPHLFEDKK